MSSGQTISSVCTECREEGSVSYGGEKVEGEEEEEVVRLLGKLREWAKGHLEETGHSVYEFPQEVIRKEKMNHQSTVRIKVRKIVRCTP